MSDSTPGNPREPVMVVAFEGWNDAGDAASTAIEHLELVWDASPLTEMEPDDYYDLQVSRPTVRIVDGVSRRVEMPTTRLSVCHPAGAESDIVLVHGLEPNMRWRTFCTELLDAAKQHRVGTVLLLGALLTDTPHTRPVPVTGAAYDEESAAKFQLTRSEYQGPTGILGLFQDRCVQAGLPAISFWAAIPHYVSQPPAPKATLALLHRIEDVLDIEVPLGGLPEQAEEWERTVSEMAEEDEDVRDYIRALEERGDEEEESLSSLTETSGEAIAAEFERYLRRRGHGGHGHGKGGAPGPTGA